MLIFADPLNSMKPYLPLFMVEYLRRNGTK